MVGILALAGSGGLLFGQNAADNQRTAITETDYPRWESLGRGGQLSPDGRWLTYQISRGDDTTELHLHMIGAGSDKLFANGGGGQFSSDGLWFAFRQGAASNRSGGNAQRGGGRGNNGNTAPTGVGLVNLTTGASQVLEGVASYTFSDDGRYLAMRGSSAPGATHRGTDLIVRALETGQETNLGNVAAYAWRDDSHMLAATIDAANGRGNGVVVFDARTGTLHTLDSSTSRYVGLSWRDDSSDLVVLRTREDDLHETPTHDILAWRGADGATPQVFSFEYSRVAGSSEELGVTDNRSPQWADDGHAVFFGLMQRPRKAAAPDGDAKTQATQQKDEDKPDMEIWHTDDVRIVPMQRSQASRDKRRNLLCVWHLDAHSFVQLAGDLEESISILPGERYVTISDARPYDWERMFGRRYEDVYLADVKTGKRTKILQKIRYMRGASPSGRFLLYFKGEDYFTYDIAGSEHRNITGQVQAQFANLEYDYPVSQYPPFGSAGWLADDAAVLLYDKYNIWSVEPDGSSATRLTDGADDEIQHRLVQLDRQAARDGIDLGQDQYLSIYGEWTKQSGYARLRDGDVEQLIRADKNISSLAKAGDADVFVYTQQAYDDSPDMFVAGPDLDDGRQITNTNAFQQDFLWGRSELINYENAQGLKLQGALTYPADYQPGKTYPMIVYVYEKLSQGLHRYTVPSERRPYNVTVFSAMGYFVLQPDIVFEAREPGVSAVDCVGAAVTAVIATGMVDADAVGLVGHSWGGYEAAFIPTQTDMFAASVAGAPLTNFFSFMGQIHWNQGLPETEHWETGQGRMDVPYWEDIAAYTRNSPASHITSLNTPMLMTFGDADGTVDWHQGVEFYNFARRAAKPMVLLVYHDENHSLRQKANQIDYHHRVLDWFGHHLKGEPAKPWMTTGVPYLEQEKMFKQKQR